MSVFEKGQEVVAIRGGTARTVRGFDAYSYEVGDEFVVTSVRRAGWLSVRRASSHGVVMTIDERHVRRTPRMIGQVPEGGIAPEDPRIAWIFEDAARMADRLDLCGDFDRLCDALGLPGRMRKFTISLVVRDGIEVTAKVEARSRRLAEMRVREQFASEQRPLELAEVVA